MNQFKVPIKFDRYNVHVANSVYSLLQLSPQFNQITATVRRARKARSMVSDDTRMVTRARRCHLSVKENNTSSKAPNPGYKPLRFVGDETVLSENNTGEPEINKQELNDLTNKDVTEKPEQINVKNKKRQRSMKRKSGTPLRDILNDSALSFRDVDTPPETLHASPKTNIPVKRLFATELGELGNPTRTKCDRIVQYELDEDLQENIDENIDLRLSPSPKEVSTCQGISPRGKEQLGSMFCSTPLGLQRRSSRFNLFSSPVQRRFGEVLVEDTPEEEYGLTMNERRLRSLRIANLIKR